MTIPYLKELINNVFSNRDFEFRNILLTRCDDYNRPHRYYHNIRHITDIISNKLETSKTKALKSLQIWILAAIYHDVSYSPLSNLNESASIELFKRDMSNDRLPDSYFTKIIKMIAATDITKRLRDEEDEEIINFVDADIRAFLSRPVAQVERQIMKEFQFLNYARYKTGRLNVLRLLKSNYGRVFEHNIQFVESYRPSVAIYAGSFNPFHIGHLNIVEKAENIFDKVVIAKGCNLSKIGKIPDATHLIHPYELKCMPYHECVEFYCTLVELIKHYEKDCDVTLVRGLRNSFDFQHELNLVNTMRDYLPSLKVVYIPCDAGLAHISSTMIKELTAFNQDVSQYSVKKFDYLP